MFNPVLISLCCYKCHYINRITPFYRSVCSTYRVLNAVSFRPCLRGVLLSLLLHAMVFLTTSSCSKCYILCCCLSLFFPVSFFLRSRTTIIIVQRRQNRTILINARKTAFKQVFCFFFGDLLKQGRAVVVLLC